MTALARGSGTRFSLADEHDTERAFGTDHQPRKIERTPRLVNSSRL